MQEQDYWREVHRLSVHAEEAHTALDHFLERVRAPFTEEELAAYDELNNAAIAASLQLDDYCQQNCPKRWFPDLPVPQKGRCSVCCGDPTEPTAPADLGFYLPAEAGVAIAVDATGWRGDPICR